jgi:hypothetical protein
MTVSVALALFLSSAFPSNSKTSWMSPQSFHLTIGMTRTEAEKTLKEFGWDAKPGKTEGELVIDYSDEKSLTLDFQRQRLHSVRFELFAFLPQVHAAFSEQKELLHKQHGKPKKTSRSVVVYDDRLPNIMVVLNADPKSEYGKKGLGYLAVRYYDPVSKEKAEGRK